MTTADQGSSQLHAGAEAFPHEADTTAGSNSLFLRQSGRKARFHIRWNRPDAPAQAASNRGRSYAGLAAAMLAGIGVAMFAVAAPARADLVRDLLGVNPFSSESSSGLREGVFVDEAGEEIVCPRVHVLEDGATVRRGEGAGLSYQLTIANLARECARGPDGRAVINVGVDIRALLGPSGRPGRFSSPVTIQLRRGDAVISRVTRQFSAVIPAGEANAMSALVERGIVLPEDTHDLLVEVGFGGAPAKARKRGR